MWLLQTVCKRNPTAGFIGWLVRLPNVYFSIGEWASQITPPTPSTTTQLLLPYLRKVQPGIDRTSHFRVETPLADTKLLATDSFFHCPWSFSTRSIFSAPLLLFDLFFPLYVSGRNLWCLRQEIVYYFFCFKSLDLAGLLEASSESLDDPTRLDQQPPPYSPPARFLLWLDPLSASPLDCASASLRLRAPLFPCLGSLWQLRVCARFGSL